jgi:hypothetical protein
MHAIQTLLNPVVLMMRNHADPIHNTVNYYATQIGYLSMFSRAQLFVHEQSPYTNMLMSSLLFHISQSY